MNKIKFIVFIILLLLFVLLFKRYYNSPFHFWSRQPVFHVYNLTYYFYSDKVIRKSLSEPNIYTKCKLLEENMPFMNYEVDVSIMDVDANENIIPFVLDLLRNNYSSSAAKIKFHPSSETFNSYFIGHDFPCFLSTYREIEPLYYLTTQSTMPVIYGCMTSRPLYVISSKKTFNCYYVDYLCVSKLKRKIGVAPKLIQSHEYYQTHTVNNTINVSLFKREGDLTGIVPLTIYKCYTYDLNNIIDNSFTNTNIPPNITIVQVSEQNAFYCYQFIVTSTDIFKIIILPSFGNFVQLIKTKNLIAYIVIDSSMTTDTNIVATYIFRHIPFSLSSNMLSCICSISNVELTIFTYFFNYIMNKYKDTYKYIAIEHISHSSLLNIYNKNSAVDITNMAYFFYNYIHRTLNALSCVIIN